MEDGVVCDTTLALSIGYYGDHVAPKRAKKDDNKKSVTCLDLSLNTHGEEAIDDMENDNGEGMVIYEDGKQSSKNSSDTNKDDDDDDDDNDNVNNTNGVRKKLMLTKEQTKFLEERFKCHPTINTTQKQVIAASLNLKPRQVEVWFQNRRARRKLKQVEVDYKLMKKCCDSLSEENRRLKRELQELRSLKFNQQTSPLFMQLSKASKRISSTEKFLRNKEKT
ncbi:hypothetical protein LIER_42492 [Lithospermum erythrorhizon]|uniref:Homeobox domain-containing protein n=1 Tax=Lithospermum erythrorhizon TaxID=34254 RepID=A0AAV3RSI0_LITER